MKKIVIKTKQTEPDYTLIASLNTLFPDCEIQVVFKGNETSEEYAESFSSDQKVCRNLIAS